MSASAKPATTAKPIMLYDHLPGILAGYPALLFLIFSVLAWPNGGENPVTWWPFDNHMLFWIGISVMIVWYIAFRFNLPKTKFWLMFGLLGTFVGIPVVLELTTENFRVFSWMADRLGRLAPEINASAWFVIGSIFGIIWLVNLVWSRTHMRVRIDESGLTINKWGGKGERFELIGLKTENEPLDYLELFIAGIGSLKLKTRMNKPIFEMQRVIGLYRTPIFPFFRGKLARIEEMLSYQGKVVSVDTQERAELAEQMDAEASDIEAEEAAAEEQVAGGGEGYDGDISPDAGPDNRDIS